VLFVEDDTLLLELMHDVLCDLGYHVLAAANGFEALEKDENYEGKIDLLLSDVDMPTLDGFELYEIMIERRPDMKVVFISGHPNLEGRLTSRPVAARILQKPIEVGLLARVLRGELECRETVSIGHSAVG
jgi:DNA-binding NtrC family response regulator